MKYECRSFRTLLEGELRGRPAARQLSELSWHVHLVGCAACRTLFESEEALEVLLATLPVPQLPPDMKRRVLAALARSRDEEADLDRLLERDEETLAPASLAARVLAGLERERELVHARANDPRAVDPLDALLDRGRDVRVDPALPRRVLERLAPARRPIARPFVLLRPAWAIALAASLAVALLAWAMWPKKAEVKHTDVVQNGVRSTHTNDTEVASAPDAQMLAALEVLENWDLLMQGDVDVLLSTIEPADEVLLEYADEG
jgi:hypothetical protein